MELVAWRKYGGPDEFISMLAKLEKQYANKHAGKDFPQPDSYKPASTRSSQGWVCIIDLSTSYNAMKAKVKQKLVEKACGDEWLWDACVNAWCTAGGEDDSAIYGKNHLNYCKVADKVLLPQSAHKPGVDDQG
ncbi:hypothetical protein FA15DRAFT_361099 [Coprinopsis marcescibilis]|uniref:Uncharacterized protein n=1 Tax=Coprinopsis marcescibilis TaxID=230819 RepID=A0A5C3KXI5_COPMA|nr:hypothetical protein FA15DRAFT_361099 [Coprinopsis marcescibilis]